MDLHKRKNRKKIKKSRVKNRSLKKNYFCQK